MDIPISLAPGVLLATLDDLIERPYRQNQIIAIEGERGLGKSHLLEKVREATAKDVERLSVHSISLPADDGVCRTFAERTSFAIAENSKPVVVLVDNIDEIAQHHEGRGTRDVSSFVTRRSRIFWHE